jgi:hypothetical protein
VGGILLVTTNFADYRHVVTRVDPNGHVLWTVSSLHSGEAWPVGMAVDSAGNAIIGAGRTVSGALRLGKVSASGAVQLDERFSGYGEGGDFDGVGADLQGNIVLSGGGGTALGGGTTPPEHRHDAWIAKLSPQGWKIWQVFGVAGHVAADREGNVLYANFRSVGKLDPNGHWIWKHSPRVDGDGEVAAVAADSTGRVIYAGSFAGRIDFGDGPAESGERPALFVAALAP